MLIPTLRVRAALVAILPMMLGIASVSWADPPKVVAPKRAPVKLDIITGHALLADKALDDAIGALKRNDLRLLTTSYRRLVRSFGHMADNICSAHVVLGRAQFQLELIDDHIAVLRRKTPTTDTTKMQTDVAFLRVKLLEELQGLRNTYKTASPSGKTRVLRMMKSTVTQVRQLDVVAAVLRENKLPLVTHLHLQQLSMAKTTMTAQLRAEEKLLTLMTRSLATLATNVPTTMRRSVRLVRARAALPHVELEQLAKHRKSLHAFLTEMKSARADIRRNLPRAPEFDPVPSDEVLPMVDDLLNPTKAKAK